jgi:predicted nucleotidyltransferase
MQVFSFWDPSHTRPSVDVFVESPVDFETLWHAATVVTLDGIDIRVASIEHLIELKRMAARPQDLADIERLRTLLDSP